MFHENFNSRSNPPMYFIVISQWPHTAETIGCSFLPLRPLNATPRYWPSTTNANVPSSMSNTTETSKQIRISLFCFFFYLTFKLKRYIMLYNNYFNSYPKIYQERQTSRRISVKPGTWRHCCFSSRGRACFCRDPIPNWDHYCPPGSGSRRCATAHRRWPRRLPRECPVASCSNAAPKRAFL